MTSSRKGDETPRFNGAAGVNPRMAGRDARVSLRGVWLQWGRGCEPADGTLTKFGADDSNIASMGPRV